MNIQERNRVAFERSKERRIQKARTRTVTVDGEDYTLRRPPVGVIIEMQKKEDFLASPTEWAIRMGLVCMGMDPDDEESQESLMDLFTLEGGDGILDAVTDMVTIRSKADPKAVGDTKERQHEQEAQEREERPLEP